MFCLRDAEYSDFHLDLSLNKKRLVRAAVMNYHTTGTYLSLKLFKRDIEQVDWDFNKKSYTFGARVSVDMSEHRKTRTNA